MRYIYIFLVVALYTTNLFGQSVEERRILKDTRDYAESVKLDGAKLKQLIYKLKAAYLTQDFALYSKYLSRSTFIKINNFYNLAMYADSIELNAESIPEDERLFIMAIRVSEPSQRDLSLNTIKDKMIKNFFIAFAKDKRVKNNINSLLDPYECEINDSTATLGIFRFAREKNQWKVDDIALQTTFDTFYQSFNARKEKYLSQHNIQDQTDDEILISMLEEETNKKASSIVWKPIKER